MLVHNAGGLSFTEALVAGLPAVTYRPIPGHGRANAAVLDAAGLAPVGAHPERAGRRVHAAAGGGRPPSRALGDPADAVLSLRAAAPRRPGRREPAGARLAAALAGAAPPRAHAAPAPTARGPLRRLTPRLAGRGRPGGVALTFDDGPDPLGTPAVLAALGRARLDGDLLPAGQPGAPVPRRRPRGGRPPGTRSRVHGDEHRNHLFRTPGWRPPRPARGRRRTISDGHRGAAALVPAALRRPSAPARCGPRRRSGSTPVLWTAWGRDWQRRPAPSAVAAAPCVRGLGAGGTVLLHDSDCTSTPGLVAGDRGRAAAAGRGARPARADRASAAGPPSSTG